MNPNKQAQMDQTIRKNQTIQSRKKEKVGGKKEVVRRRIDVNCGGLGVVCRWVGVIIGGLGMIVGGLGESVGEWRLEKKNERKKSRFWRKKLQERSWSGVGAELERS
jgi:hypothetical protein